MDLPLDSKYVKIRKKKKLYQQMYHYLRTNRPLFFIIIISFEKSKRKEGIKNRMTVHSRNNNNNKLECFTFIDQGITRVRKRRKTWRA